MAKKKKEEFVFDQDSGNGGKLTYRCMEFIVISNEDEMPESEIEFWKDVVRTLNVNFPHRD